MNNKKILFFTRDSLYKYFGGDTVQVQKTKQALESKYGLNIKILCDEGKMLSDYDFDILHIWGINASPILDEIVSETKKRGKIVIVSTIYWNILDSLFLRYFVVPFFNSTICPFMEKISEFCIKRIMLPIAYIFPNYRKKLCYIFGSQKFKTFRQNIIKNADFIIPNSDEEGRLLCEDIDLDYEKVRQKFISVPNAVDIENLNSISENKILPQLSNFIIEAAGLQPLKNQISVVKALMKNREIPIVFAGETKDEKDDKYCIQLKKLSEKRGNVYFTGKIDRIQLFDLYKRAKVHILPSFRESPGLVTIEALMNGCQIVVSNEKFCPIKYYKFDKYGFICNPYDVKSIKDAILNAYNSPKNIKLPEKYFDFYSYDNVAEMIYQIYKRVIVINEEPINANNR